MVNLRLLNRDIIEMIRALDWTANLIKRANYITRLDTTKKGPKNLIVPSSFCCMAYDIQDQVSVFNRLPVEHADLQCGSVEIDLTVRHAGRDDTESFTLVIDLYIGL